MSNARQLAAFIVGAIACVIMAFFWSDCQKHQDAEFAKAHIEKFKPDKQP